MRPWAALLAALPVAAALGPGHPALRVEGPLGDAARTLAAGAGRGPTGWGVLSAVDAGAPAAAGILLASLLYMLAWGVVRLGGTPVPGAAGGGRTAVPLAALAGHLAALALLPLRPSPSTLSAAAAGFAAVMLLARRSAGGAPSSPAAAWKWAPLVVLGAALHLLAGAVDGLLGRIAPGPPFPEAWFAVASDAGAGWLRAPVLGAVAAAGAAALAVERALDGAGGRGGAADLLAAAPAWALLLGPSNPARALALALALAALARAGLPPAGRAAFVAALVAGTAAGAHVA